MNEKKNLRIYMALQYEFIRFSLSEIQGYLDQGYSEDHPQITIPRRMIEWYRKRIRETQIQLEVLIEKGK